MTYWTDHIAVGVFYASVLLALAWTTRAVWRLWWRRDDLQRVEQQAQLQAAIAAEAETDDRCDHSALDRQTPIAVDPPVTRIYVEPGWVMFRGGLVHTACVSARLRDGTSCAGCAVHLDHVLTGAK